VQDVPTQVFRPKIIHEVAPVFGTGRESKKVALTACMRKLRTILNVILKHRTSWRQVETQHA